MEKAQPISKSVFVWLRMGWQYFLQTKWQSIAFSSVFVVVGFLLSWYLVESGYSLILYPLFAGFLIMGPVLIMGFQVAGNKIRHGQTPKFNDFLVAGFKGSWHIWLLVGLLSFCYLIWLTDALVIYSLYFGFEGNGVINVYFESSTEQQALVKYLIYSTVGGLFFAIIGFILGAFSIPLMLHQNANFVQAVMVSLRTIKANFFLCFCWSITLALVILVPMIVFLPLLVVLLPVTGYGSYIAYVALVEEQS